MQNQSQFKVLKNISKVFDKASNSKLSASFYNKAGTDLHYLESYFNLSPNDTLMLTLVFAMNYENNDAIGITEIADHLKISAVKLLEFQESFESLSKIGVLLKSKPGHFNSSRIGISNFKYQVSQKLVSQVISDAPAINLTSECYYDVIDFMERVVLLTEERSYDNISTLQLIDEVMGMVEAHENLPLLKKLSPYKLDILEKIFFINLVWAALNGEEEKDLTSITDDIIGESSMKIRFMQLFLNGRSCLLKHDLIGLSKSEFFNNTEIRLTDNAETILNSEGIKTFKQKEIKKQGILSHRDIGNKKLYYNPDMAAQLDLLKKSIRESNLRRIRKKLASHNLPIGVNVLLYGAPGTGKTELVYQLARLTKRNIIPIEISQTKSMWFGESEKLISKVFSDYRKHLKTETKAPILLFNEADGILGKRIHGYRSSTEQSLNAMQNIMLDELEKFEGIFIATTNLETNLDQAFDRRFLHKIAFAKPDVITKARIWKSKLASLRQGDCNKLAQAFELTGGQIDNIVRKCAMTDIITGQAPDITSIMEFCHQETMNIIQKSTIGFKPKKTE